MPPRAWQETSGTSRGFATRYQPLLRIVLVLISPFRGLRHRVPGISGQRRSTGCVIRLQVHMRENARFYLEKFPQLKGAY